MLSTRIHFTAMNVTRVLMLLACCATLARAEENWPRWGGPDGSSHTAETGLPLSWTEADVAWKTSLEGFGQSMPCIWGERIFLTTALDEESQRVVFAIDRRTGRQLWRHVAWTGEPEASHKMNGHASATCATNGKIVVAFFGKGGLHAYSLDGEPLWSRDLGALRRSLGHGRQPDLLWRSGDTKLRQRVARGLAVGRRCRTGETVWNTPRKSFAAGARPSSSTRAIARSWCSTAMPTFADTIRKRARELWKCASFNGRGEPVPAFAHGKLFVINGLYHNALCCTGAFLFLLYLCAKERLLTTTTSCSQSVLKKSNVLADLIHLSQPMK